MVYTTNYRSPLGDILLSSDGKNLTGLWFKGQKYFADKIGHEVKPDSKLTVFNQTKTWLDAYFAGQNPSTTDVPLAPLASAKSEFKQNVWDRLLAIPYGELKTYGEIAKEIDCKSAHAVGGAVGHNPISILIPCHRVIGANGSLTGYAGGLDRKIRLLELEKADMSHLFVPNKSTAL